jgi:vitamin B12 transporter
LAIDPVAAAETVVVTATRTARTADQLLHPVTVIGRDDIERRQARSVQELLAGTPGMTISNNGGPGKASSMFLRGTESDHVLVLIDGVKAGSATLGATAFENLPVEEIDRIEVVRGPRSSLYGSEAIGGVVQIFTRRGEGPPRPRVSIGAGSFGTTSASAGVSGGSERVWFNAGVSGESTDGFNACRGDPLIGGCFTVEPDDDGYDNRSGSLAAGYRLGGGGEVDFSFLRADGDAEFDGDFQNETDVLQRVFRGRLRLPLTERWESTLIAGRSNEDTDNFKDGVFASRFDSERDSVTWQNDLYAGDAHVVTLGFDWLDDEIDSNEAFAVTSRDNEGVFGQYQGSFGAHDVQLGARHDDNEQFGGHATGSVAWGYEIGGGRRLTASYGTAFRAPTFNELYFPGFGNPDLEPEESDSVEIGLSGDGERGRWSLHLFRTAIDEMIAFDAASSAPANIDEARIRGLEAVVGRTFGPWRVDAGLTLLDTENRSPGFDGNELPRRAGEVLRVDVDRRAGRFGVGVTVLYESDRFDDLGNTRPLDSYATVDLRGEWALTGTWLLGARIVNVFDEDYETAEFYNQAERSFFVTLRYAADR